MSNSNWESKFEKLFEAGVLACKAGEQQPDKLVTTRDQAFLGTIGCTAQEFFDFADDFCEYGAPDFATALAVTTIRRRYFLDVQHGIPSQFQVDPHELPPKNEALDGFRWLPRIIAKARGQIAWRARPLDHVWLWRRPGISRKHRDDDAAIPANGLGRRAGRRADC